jgi:hypothetical protein
VEDSQPEEECPKAKTEDPCPVHEHSRAEEEDLGPIDKQPGADEEDPGPVDKCLRAKDEDLGLANKRPRIEEEDLGLKEEYLKEDKVFGRSLFILCRAMKEFKRTDEVLERPAEGVFQLLRLTEDQMAIK